MKRHPALVPLSHDHHHTLVQARRLREDGLAAAREFLRFFASETTRHFREEEELVFPLLYGDEPVELQEVLLQHQRLRSLAARLRDGEDVSRELGELLEAHVRLEERDLFDLIQRRVPDEQLAAIGLAPREPAEPVVDLAAGAGRGPLWGTAAEDLNATLLAWDPGEGPADHVNAERDVLYVVVAGGGTLTIDGEPRPVRAPTGFVVEKGQSRGLRAGPDGIRYVTAHLKRQGLEIRAAPPRAAS